MSLRVETIQACTRGASLGRGEKYYREGRVTDVSQDGATYKATIIGTDRYSVILDTESLAASCDCYAYQGDDWCKHIVALALTIASGPFVSAEQPQVKKGYSSGRRGTWSELEASLPTQPATTLAEIIQLAADRHPDIWDVADQVLNPPVLDSPKDILKAVKAVFTPVKRATNWHRQTEAAIEASQTMARTAESAPASEAGLRGLLAAAVWAYAQLDQIDDSDGELQEGIASLTQRAVLLANEHHEWMALLYAPLAEPTDLPLIEMILSKGDETVRENCVQRLDIHINRRDPLLAAVNQGSAEYYLLRYLASRGDERLLKMLDDAKIHENVRRNALVEYYTARQDWQAIIDELWSARNEHRHYFHAQLWNALQKVGDVDKLIEYQTEDVLSTADPLRALAKLEHFLRQHHQESKYAVITEQVLASPRVNFAAKLELLHSLKRYDEAAELACRIVRDKPGRSDFGPWNSRPNSDIVASFAEKLMNDAPQATTLIWRALFEHEKTIVTQSSVYLRFEIACDRLSKLQDQTWLVPHLQQLAVDFPTRKKLVQICQSYLT